MTEVETAPAPAPTGILPPADKRDPKAKIPGLDITWEMVDVLKLADSAIEELLAIKKKHGAIEVHIIPTDREVYVIRGCTRLEWRMISQRFSNMDDARENLTKEGVSGEAAEKIVGMMYEDKVVEHFLVKPKMTISQIREMPPGEVALLFQSIMLALGFGQQPRAIKL